MIIIFNQVTITWAMSFDHMTLSIRWHSSSADLNSTSTPCLLPPTYLCHLFFSNFRSEAEWSEPACILSWYVCFEDIDKSEKEREGGEACWVGVTEWWRREGGREGGREGERKEERKDKMIQHNWYRRYTPPFTAMWMSKSPSAFLSTFTSNTNTCEKNNQQYFNFGIKNPNLCIFFLRGQVL